MYQHSFPSRSLVPSEFNNEDQHDTRLIASDHYLNVCNEPSTILLDEHRPRQLVVLDLNGTLVDRITDGMYVRPHQDVFLDYLFKHFDVMVWSSAQPRSVANMCRLFGPHRLLCAWDRSSAFFQLSHHEYHGKFPTIKNLEAVWWAFGRGSRYNARNTILIDDSESKATMQPHNAIHVSEFSHRDPRFLRHGDKELIWTIAYLEQLRRQSNVCNYIRRHPYRPPPTHNLDPLPNDRRVFFYDFIAGTRQLVDFGMRDYVPQQHAILP